jgi:hypothetical protein
MRVLVYALLLCVAVLLAPARAQGQNVEAPVQEFYSQVSAINPRVYFDLFAMQAGQTVYIYAESAEIDPEVAICDLACKTRLAENDNLGPSTAAGLSYTFPTDGDYTLVVADCCTDIAEGVFRVLIGLEAPEVLAGGARSNGGKVAVPYGPSYEEVRGIFLSSDPQVQVLRGEITSDTPIIYYDIEGMQAGQELFIYTASEDVDTYIQLCDLQCQNVYADDDDGGGGTNSAISFPITQDGDYSIAVTDCCNLAAQGEVEIRLGLNAPEVIGGGGIPNGAEIAVLYEPGRRTVAADFDPGRAPVDCSELFSRPLLSGPMQTAQTEFFVVHYTLGGIDATTSDFVEEVLAVLDDFLQIQVEQYGWILPTEDCGEGGDQRFDIYLSDITGLGILGYAEPQGLLGDNPATERRETRATYSYLMIDNDFAGLSHSNPLSLMRATIAHEIHHAIQFSYNPDEALLWYYEATASWMETQTYPGEEDASRYTASVFASPDLCIGGNPDPMFFNERIYGEWLLIDTVAREYGIGAVRDIWELITTTQGMKPFYQMIEQYGGSPAALMQTFAIRNLLLDYLLAAKFPQTVRLEASVNGVGELGPERDGVQELGVDYVSIRFRGVYTFRIEQPNLNLVVVGVDEPLGTAQIFPLGQAGTVDTSPFTHAYLLILNTDSHDDPATCQFTDWVLQVENGAGAPLSPALPDLWNAENFIPAG